MSKNHWSNNSTIAGLICVFMGFIGMNLVGILSVIHFVLVSHLWLFIALWLLGTIASFFMGILFVFYCVTSVINLMLFKETGKINFLEFILSFIIDGLREIFRGRLKKDKNL